MPVWFMRQAGRSLPEYRASRKGIGMLESCTSPELVAEITLQPVRRYGVDAAILYSDIMLPLQAAGVDLDIVSGTGPVIAAARSVTPLTWSSCGRSIRPTSWYVTEAVGLMTAELGRRPADRLRRRSVHSGQLSRRGRPEPGLRRRQRR